MTVAMSENNTTVADPSPAPPAPTPTPTAAPVTNTTNTTPVVSTPTPTAETKMPINGSCLTVDASTTHPLGKKCYNNVIWAKETGIKTQPQMYENYTTLTNTSSFADFQCALYGMVGGDEAGTGHGCPMPCGSTLPDCYQAPPPEDK